MPRHLPALLSICTALLLVPSVLADGFPLQPDSHAIKSAVLYIESNQNGDGGFGLNSQSDLSTTARALIALSAAGIDPLTVRTGGMDPLDYLASVSVQALSGNLSGNKLADNVNMILALSALGADPRNFNGINFLQSLLDLQNGTTGRFGKGALDTAYAVLALRSAGLSRDDPALLKARDYLEQAQLADGSFEYSPGWGGDSNSISLAIMALNDTLSSTASTVSTRKALDALMQCENATNGGFFYQAAWGTKPDVSSTALAIQAIVTTGGNPTLQPWAGRNADPVSYLLSTQNTTTGEFYDPYGSLRPTTLAVTALLGSSICQILQGPTYMAAASLALLILLGRRRVGAGVG